ncbi:hypothetical protein Taro_040074 [Colocasia esculenta]|uniref:Uncharacterized protein n=1 Tax=Colocasia esculenta TaxID=4460 RepID=A0A843WXH1_COLES|nr:hypothetical protein [Colocasia esculenta]
MEFILLLVSSLLLTARAAAAASNPVLDVDGNELRRGHRYHAISVSRPGSGLRLAARSNGRCPLNVAQAPSDDFGRPLAFFPENTDDDTVREGSTLNIIFPEPTECPESTVWKLDREWGIVTTGGTLSSAIGRDDSRFAIRRAGDASSEREYQIDVCPCSIGVRRPSCRMACVGSLGLTEQEANLLLNVNNERPHTISSICRTSRRHRSPIAGGSQLSSPTSLPSAERAAAIARPSSEAHCRPSALPRCRRRASPPSAERPAAIAGKSLTLSRQLQFATNHLGPFFLTKLLLNKMKATAKETGTQGRIINVSSSDHAKADGSWLDLDTINDLSK